MKTYLLGPALSLAYGLIRLYDGLDDKYGPGGAWTIGHLAFLAGLAFFVPVILDLRRRAADRPALALVPALFALAGAAALAVQFVIDISVGFASTSRPEMSSHFQQISGAPGVEPLVYGVVPQFFFLGLVVQLAVLAAVRRLPWWSPAAALAGILVVLVAKDLIPLTGVLLGLALLPAALDRTERTRPHGVPPVRQGAGG
ncbi:hypothetical protein [Actinomadura algeriensis]|uniref:Xanthosine utilization system XapX-like protein n=1 Tax=Actinomadura algeriensis TaxID=1679523 RepID=A0ABR9JTQ5_9ACTN|nr:hypothetical protein [Actinomadura algeriensis]MBE1533746.1 xanthosine utilization system XapX-like protein [Actinomadura algeriensis]